MFSPNFTRTSSTGSIDMLSPGSSAQNTDCSLTTDDDDSDHKSSNQATYKERRREAHTQGRLCRNQLLGWLTLVVCSRAETA